MSHQSDLISTDINAYLAQHERKELLRLLTCGSVDDGKSTLIGRLLHDSKMIYEDHMEALKTASVKSGTTGAGNVDLALLVDGLQAEREQGITIDVAYRYFSTAKRKFIIADTPGHEQYTRNMATGASNCELAIILIDARHGVQVQTRRHSFIATLLGIQNIIVAINKMDLLDFRQEVFEGIRQDYLNFAKDLDIPNLSFIPISALDGDNVVNPSERSPWYEGETLMNMLESVKINADRNFEDFRFPVQFVNRPNLDFRGFCGTVASGLVRKGDDIVVLPSGKTSRVKSIVTQDEELQLAYPPMAITLTLEDEIDISRGDMIVHPGNLPDSREDFTATIVWMNEQAMVPGKQYDFKHTSASLSGQITMIRHKVDVNTLEKIDAPPVLELNEIGLCDISLNQPAHFDAYRRNRSTGSFIVIDRLSNVTVGAGMIEDASSQIRRSSASRGHVSESERALRYGQKPVTVIFTGLSGSGKTTLAQALERRLFDMGKVASVLDGKVMRLGLSKDLPHDAAGRAENLRRSAYVARHLNESGLICCAAFVAASADARDHTLAVIGQENCILVWLNPPLDVCRQRDPSGLYAAEENMPGSGNVPGISFPYEEPSSADLILATHELDVDECIDRVINVMRERQVF